MNTSESETSHAPEDPVPDSLVDAAFAEIAELGKLLHTTLGCHPVAAGRPPGQIKALLILDHHGRRTVGEVAAGIGVSMPTASELLDRLVEEGLAERETNPSDRRQVFVRPTAAARAIGGQIKAARRHQLRAAIARLDPAERPVFVRSLAALTAALRDDLDRAIAHPVALGPPGPMTTGPLGADSTRKDRSR